jgi:multidrug efflux pump subunit AcrA (membrane-fusion protein)
VELNKDSSIDWKIPQLRRNIGTIFQDYKLLPNVNVNVSVITARHENALTVPREAVHAFDGKSVVYEIANGRIVSREVETGLSSLTRVQILSGINENTRIALGAINAIISCMSIGGNRPSSIPGRMCLKYTYQ